MKTPDDRTITMAFGSHPTKDIAMRWQAWLDFPPDSTAETRLPIRVLDGYGRPVAEGEFEFAGRRLPVREGSAEIRYADFIAGKHEVALWLHRPGVEPIPGGLTFE